MKPLTMRQISAIVGGKWVKAPADMDQPVLHYALYKGELRQDIGPANLLFAMSLKHWQAGTKNTGIYATTFRDNHSMVLTLQPYIGMAIVERPVTEAEVPQLMVPNAYDALEKLVVATAKDYTGKSIGVTGTVGKSTTRKFIADLLSHIGTTSTTPGNLNSRTSVKIQAMNHDCRQFNVLEIAATGLSYKEPGHGLGGVASLLSLDLAVLTQVDAGQKGWSASRTADIKTRMGVALKPGQPFLVNADIKNIAEVKTDVYRFTKNLVTYGLAADSDYRGQVTDGQLTLFHGENKLTTLSVSGLDTGTISDVIGALAAYDLLGGTMSSAIMAEFRQQCAHTTTRKVMHFEANERHVTIIDDTHNAERLSVKNFIDYAQNYPVGERTRKIFIAGRIINLRQHAYQVHKEVLESLNQAHFDHFYLYGPEIDQVIPVAQPGTFAGYYTTPNQILRAIAAEPHQDLVIFIKGSSRDSTIDSIAPRLAKRLAYTSSDHNHFAMSVVAENEAAYVTIGVGRLLVVLEVLKRLANGKLRLTDQVPIVTDLAAERSVNKVDVRKGTSYSVYELVTAAIVASVPDVILNLAEYLYGSNHKAFIGVQHMGRTLGLTADTTHNITGRPTKRAQRTYLADLKKIGAAYCQLPNEVFSLLGAQHAMFNGHWLQKRSQLTKTGKTLGSIFQDQQERTGLLFWVAKRQKHVLAVLDSPHVAYADALAEDMVTVDAQPGTPKVESVTLTSPVVNFLADTYFGEDYTRRRKRHGREDALQKFGYSHSFEKLRPFFGRDAYNVFNFEAVFAQGVSPLDAVKPFVLDAAAAPTLAEFKHLHFNLAMLGNNHANDYGSRALSTTLTQFNQAGISTIGAGNDRLEARKIVELTYGNQQVALFNGYWYRNPAYNLFDFYASADHAGVNCLDTMMADDIRQYKQSHPGATVIVSAHWGTDYGVIKPAQRTTAERLVRAGADLIIGHGPHRLQPIEYVGAVPVLYSIGNGVFNNDGEFERRGVPPYAAVLRLDLAKRQLYWCPIYANNLKTFWQPDFVSAADFEKVAQFNQPRFAVTQLAGNVNALVLPF